MELMDSLIQLSDGVWDEIQCSDIAYKTNKTYCIENEEKFKKKILKMY